MTGWGRIAARRGRDRSRAPAPLRPAVRLCALALACALAAGGATACTGGQGGESQSADGGGQTEGPAEPGLAPGSRATGGSGDSAGSGSDGRAQGSTPGQSAVLAETGRYVARRASLALQVRDVDAAAARVRVTAAEAGGTVLREDLHRASDAGDGAVVSTVTVSVPAARLDATLDRLARLGRVEDRSSTAEDVTGSYVDTRSRVATMEASVARVRALMSRATKLGDVVQLESELARRQADLDALKAQLAALRGSVDMSPVEVRLGTEGSPLSPAPAGGFLDGLRAGWQAFSASVVLLLTVLGAVLPFALAAAVVVVPLLLWLRRRRQVAGAKARAAGIAPAASAPVTSSTAGSAPAAVVPAPAAPAGRQPPATGA